jgi:energy-coupling factor transporter ATP-binding protein EcfA2
MTLPVLNLEPLWLSDGSVAVREALGAAVQRQLSCPTTDEPIPSVGSLSAEIGIRALNLHSEVFGDLASKVIPDMVNRESRLATADRELESGMGGSESASPVPESTIEHMVLDSRTRDTLDRIVEHARSGNRCVLLVHGPSGVGKSYLGRCLAGSLERPAVAVRSSEIRGKHYGEEERLMRKLFERAMAREEVLIFDEADEWVGRREGTSACESGGRIIESSEMLLNLERFTGVAVLTTNRSEVLDPALHRRVDVWLSMPMPGPEERLALWARALDGKLALLPSALVTLASVPLAGGDVEACVAQVEASVGVLTEQALMDAAMQRADLRTWLG